MERTNYATYYSLWMLLMIFVAIIGILAFYSILALRESWPVHPGGRYCYEACLSRDGGGGDYVGDGDYGGGDGYGDAAGDGGYGDCGGDAGGCCVF